MSDFMTRENLRDFFQKRVLEAMRNQRVDRSERAEVYLVNLLSEFSSAQPLTKGAEGRAVHAPLALKLKDAMEAPSVEERFSHLRDLGDLALYVAGFFSDYITRRAVDFDYYVSMGEGAYQSVSSLAQRRSFGEEVAGLFRELAMKFTKFVDVLAEISEESHIQKNQGILRLYERWQRTQSSWSERRLKELGVVPGLGDKKGPLH
jgi:hypothetical protein